MRVYFSDIFNVKPNIIEKYGAFNISLVNDLPLFVDPFLLFNSRNKDYKKLHQEILKYVAFLRDRSLEKSVNHGLLKSWYCFPEVKQTWLGYSQIGNSQVGWVKRSEPIDAFLLGVLRLSTNSGQASPNLPYFDIVEVGRNC